MNDGEGGVVQPLYGILSTSCRKKMALQRRSDSGVSLFSYNLSYFIFLS